MGGVFLITVDCFDEFVVAKRGRWRTSQGSDVIFLMGILSRRANQCYVQMMKRKILAMYCGGLDSAGALYRLLTDPEFEDADIHVHHMHVVNQENRAPAENEAVRKTLKIMSGDGYKPHVYTQSLHRYEFIRRDLAWNRDLSAFIAGNICVADPSITNVAMGRTRTDLEKGGEPFLERMERAQKIFKAVISLDESDASYIFPVVKMTKKDIWDMLPGPIRHATWACRRPVYDKDKRPFACGKCNSCKERAEITRYCPVRLEA